MDDIRCRCTISSPNAIVESSMHICTHPTDDIRGSHPLPSTQVSIEPSKPIYMYPLTKNPQHTTSVRRQQVKIACINCKKACKKCDEGRPCLRCIKYGIPSECVNPIRKERQKGLKRGPYNKQPKDSSSFRCFDERAHLPEIRSNATDGSNGVHNLQLSNSQLQDPVMAARTGPSHPVGYSLTPLVLLPALDTHSYSAVNNYTCLRQLPSSPSCDYHEGALLSLHYSNVQNVQQPVNQQASNGNAYIL